jgi:phospholipid/cholesterol/gamma-HCH transport system substrate-binding protein
MSGRKTQNVIVGTVVLAALFVLVFGMAFLNEYHPGESNVEYTIVAGQVGLLTAGDPVKFNGVKVGKVKTIRLQADHKVAILVQVASGVGIPVGSAVEIQNVGLMGERMINVVLAPGGTSYPPGSTLQATYDYGIAETMGAAGELIEQAKGIVDELQRVVDSTVGRPDFVPRVNNVVRRADEVSDRLDRLVAQIEPQVKHAAGDLASAGHTARSMADRAAPVVDSVADRADRTTAELGPMVEDLKAVSADIRVLSDKAKDGRSTIGKLANDTAFYQQLSSAVVRADSLIRRIQRKGLDINVGW